VGPGAVAPGAGADRVEWFLKRKEPNLLWFDMIQALPEFP